MGAGGTRNISGNSTLHEELENELADLHGQEVNIHLLEQVGYIDILILNLLNEVKNSSVPIARKVFSATFS